MKDIDVGAVIAGKYVLTRLIGRGAMGQVWLGRHEALHQDFALKLLVPPRKALEDEKTAHRRFENEAQIAAALSRRSRHIVAVNDFGADDGVSYLVMELLEGETLEARLEKGRLGRDEVLRLVAGIAQGLTVAHDLGVTHRDLKPANVFLARDRDGSTVVKLLDFGIARLSKRIVPPRSPASPADPTKLTVKGVVLGTPAYMSPEQAMAEDPDARADVWSLAVIAYEALAGQTPFAARTVEETLLRICNCRATPLRELIPDASPELEAVFAKAFSSNAADRFQSASELEAALVGQLRAVPQSLPRTRQTSRVFAIIVGAALLVLAAAALRHTLHAAPLAPTLSPTPTPPPTPTPTPTPTPSPSQPPPPSPKPSASPPPSAPAPSASAKPTDRSAIF